MIKGIAAIILGSLLLALAVVGIFYLLFTGILLWIAAFFAGAFIIAALILFVLAFLLCILMFFAFFYYLAEKKPVVTPGQYRLDEEKGKNE